MSRLPLVVGALAALLVARALPAEGVGLWLRLASATLLLLVPGALVGRAVRAGGASGALIWSVAALVAVLTPTFLFHRTIGFALALLVVLALAAAPFALRREPTVHPPGWALVGAVGVVFGLALWRVAQTPAGDALFHLARIRKLLELDDLSLHRVVEFSDGGLHPGYAFPLWHGFLALVARLAAVDPALVVEHESSVLAPLAFLVVFEAGAALFRSSWLAAGVVAAQVALTGLAAGSGGAFRSLALPASAGGRLLLAPAVLALVFAFLREPVIRSLIPVAAAGLVLALVHPTYALFIGLALTGFVGAHTVLVRRDLLPPAQALAGFGAPVVLVALWLLPIARDTVSQSPSAAVLLGRAHGLARYPGQIDVFSEDRYRLAPEVISRGGAVAVAALLSIPLAAFAARRKWAAFVLGSSVLLLTVLLTPVLFPWLVDAVSLSQARRAAGFLPLPFALAGGAAVLARPLGWALVPVAFGAGILLQHFYPGDFGYVLREGGPPFATWFALVGGLAALIAGSIIGGRVLVERRGAVPALAVFALIAPVAWQALGHWDRPRPGDQLSAGLVHALRLHTRPGDVVFSDPHASYRIAATVPVYVASSEPAHVADTPANRPYRRQRDARTFFRTGDTRLLRRYRADWLVLDRRRYPGLTCEPATHRDARFTLCQAAGVRATIASR